MSRRALTGLAVVVLLLSAASLVVLGPGEDTKSGGTELGIEQSNEFDSTVFRIRVLENGDARWIIEYGRILDTDEEVTQFEEFAEQFRTEETDAFSNFKVRAETLTQSGTETTGREMNATTFERNASVDQLGQTRGVIEMSFLWTNFSQIDESSVVVADVFGGGWAIVENQRLTIQAGEGVVFDEVVPEPDSMTVTGNLTASQSVTWFGERQFADERPRIALVPEEQAIGTTETPAPTATPTATETADTSTNSPTDGKSTGGETENATTETPSTDTDATEDIADGSTTNPESGSDRMPMLVLGLLVLGLGTGYAWYSGAIPHSDGSETQSSEPTTSGTETPETPLAESSPQVTDEELLSDEDRVIQLLEQNGGRMKQVDIVEETEWSKSKVSMLLSEMDQEDQISKLRVGRENIISLAGEEPDAASSPFDSE
jgi:uncharacterized membrane protein